MRLIDSCALCKGNPFFSLDGKIQYYSVIDSLWNGICKEKRLKKDVMVCADCFEKNLGRPFNITDFIMCPVSFEFMRGRGIQTRFLNGLGRYLTKGYWKRPKDISKEEWENT